MYLIKVIFVVWITQCLVKDLDNQLILRLIHRGKGNLCKFLLSLNLYKDIYYILTVQLRLIWALNHKVK